MVQKHLTKTIFLFIKVYFILFSWHVFFIHFTHEEIDEKTFSWSADCILASLGFMEKAYGKNRESKSVNPLSVKEKSSGTPAPLHLSDKFLTLNHVLVQRVGVGGRIKPFDTFARESLFSIYGKEHFKQWEAAEVVISWMLAPQIWYNIPIIQVRKSSLRKVLNLGEATILYSPKRLLDNPVLKSEWQELKVRLEQNTPLSSYFQSLKSLIQNLTLFQDIANGDEPGWVPATPSWLPVSKMTLEDKPLPMAFRLMLTELVVQFTGDLSALQETSSNKEKGEEKPNEPKKESDVHGEGDKLKKAILHFFSKAGQVYPDYINDLKRADVEIHYNQVNPMRMAWMCYLLCVLLFLLTFFLLKKPLLFFWIGAGVGGFVFHTYGMILRSYIMERPPVTNMYETLLWVPWIGILFGIFLWKRLKFLAPVVCAVFLSFFCLLLLELSPSLLDKSLQPLEAVLRSNFWLSTHVLVITMSYAAFFLAFVLGDVSLFFFLKNEERYKKTITQYHRAIKLCFQIGVVLLAGGTILGGIWADYSWGRFWGWDPKETWALISLLAYLALLHGTLVGWVREFGTALGAVVLFFFIVMTWYGVNFVLGQGLHSYGFGSGGIEYVTSFCLLHVGYVLLVSFMRQKRLRKNVFN